VFYSNLHLISCRNSPDVVVGRIGKGYIASEFSRCSGEQKKKDVLQLQNSPAVLVSKIGNGYSCRILQMQW